MLKKLLNNLFVLSLGGLASGPVVAATVVLDNGDRLTGTVERLEGDKLLFKTAYAGTLAIDWNKVVKLETDKNVVLLTRDDRVLQGVITASPQSGYQLKTSEGEVIEAAPATIAVVNPEDWRIGRASKWSGQFSLALKIETGNSEKSEVDLDLNTTLRRKDDRFQFRGDVEYDTSLGSVTKSKWNVLGKYDYFVTDREYYAANASAERDLSKGLDYRYHLGPSVGYQFYEGYERNLKAEIGLYYTASDIVTKGRSSNIATGWLVDFDHRFDFEPLQTYHWQSMILSDPENMNFKSKTGLRVPLAGDFLGSAEIEANWDAETATDTSQTEVIYRVKVGYGW